MKTLESKLAEIEGFLDGAGYEVEDYRKAVVYLRQTFSMVKKAVVQRDSEIPGVVRVCAPRYIENLNAELLAAAESEGV